MKKLLIGFVAFALCGSAGADVFKAKLGERLAIPIKMALDTNGYAHIPDSVEVTTYQQGATAATKFRSYTYANATASTGWFDSTLNGGRVAWWLNTYVDSLGSTPTSKIIGVNVTMFYQGVPFEQTHLVEVGSYNFDSTAYRGAIRAIGDSTTSLTTLRDTLPKYTWAYDSATAAGFAATSMGRQLTKDISATVDAAAIADSVWGKNLSAFSTGLFPKAGKLLYLAGDSTAYVNQYDVWNVPFTYAFTAGTMGDSMNNATWVGNMGAVSGDATAADNFETMLDGTGGKTLSLLQLDIGGAAGGNGAVYLHNSSGPAIYGVSQSTSYPTLYFWNNSSGTYPAALFQGAVNGNAMTLIGGSGAGHGLASYAGTGASAFYGSSTTGPAFNLLSTGSDGFKITAGGSSGFGMKLTGSGSGAGIGAIGGTTGFAGSFISSGPYGIFTQGASAGMYNYAQSGTGFVADGAVGMQAISATGPGFTGTVDSVSGVGSGGSGSADTTSILALAQNHPDAFYGPTASGSLLYTHHIYVVDTGANPDDPLQGVTVVLSDTSGTPVSWGVTDQNGLVLLASDAGIYNIAAVHRPWSFPVSTVTITTNTTDSLLGYNGVTGSICRVYGYVTDWGINPTEFATVTFTMPEGVNGSDSTILLDRSVTVETDDDGYFYADLARSSYLSNKQWQVTINYPGVSAIKRSFTVPDATSYKLGW